MTCPTSCPTLCPPFSSALREPPDLDQESRPLQSTPTTATTAPVKTVLLEIVGVMGLIAKHPYCIVRDASGKQVHRTATADENPIWTIQSGGICIVPVQVKPHAFLSIQVHNSKKIIGTSKVLYSRLLNGTGERHEFEVIDRNGNQTKARLALRYRLASTADVVFLQQTKVRPRKTPTAGDVNFHHVPKPPVGLFTTHRKVIQEKEHVRVDFPDDTVKWMTREQIHDLAMQPSEFWSTAGSGVAGRIYLEVIRCNNLPNMDLNVNDLTDAFVGICFEDTMVRTDVIWDNLDPSWLPWQTRAFCFHVHHSASILLLGVFDFDDVPLNYHDPIGRVVINTANFHANTDYVLHYRLHHDPRQLDNRGSITVRLRIEWEDECQAMKMSFTTPPRFIINVENDKSYQVLRYIARGSIDMEKPSVDSVKLYANELISYWQNYCFALDVLFEVLLWRGRLQISKERTIWFPMHSVALMVAVVSIIEFPNKVIPILLYSVGWIMLAINYHASRHPNPWKRVKSSEEANMMIIFGKTIVAPREVKPQQGVREGETIDELDKVKAQRMSTLIREYLYFLLKVYRIYSKTSESYFVITTVQHDWSFLSERLYYLHMLLKYWCTYIRLFRNLVNWRGYYADVLTTNCIMVATLWMILPIDVVACWVVRIAAWTLLGPWMKLLDVFWVQKWYKTKEELLNCIECGDPIGPQVPDFDAWLTSSFFMKMSHSGRVMAEDSFKLKGMRDRLFGHFSERIPAVDNSRFPAIPLPNSTAKPCNKDPSLSAVQHHIPGQRLKGHIIMTAVDERKADDKQKKA